MQFQDPAQTSCKEEKMNQAKQQCKVFSSFGFFDEISDSLSLQGPFVHIFLVPASLNASALFDCAWNDYILILHSGVG